jgi:hypothetical protein
VTGSATDESLGEALACLLAPAKVTFVIRDELVVLTPAREQKDKPAAGR